MIDVHNKYLMIILKKNIISIIRLNLIKIHNKYNNLLNNNKINHNLTQIIKIILNNNS